MQIRLQQLFSDAPFCLIVVAVATCMRLWILNGVHGHDDWVYLFVIRCFFNQQSAEILGSLWGLRWGVWCLPAWLFSFFGPSIELLLLPGFLMGLASVPLVYFTARRLLVSVAAARWVAIVYICNPVDWFVSTTFRGDIELSLCGAVLIWSISQENKVMCMQCVGGLTLAGLVWGLGCLVKEWALVYGWGFAALVAYKALMEKGIPWRYLVVLGCFAGVFILDAACLHLVTGDMLHRFSTSFSWYERAWVDGGYVKDLSVHLAYLPSVMLGLENEYTKFGRFGNGYPLIGAYFCVLLPGFVWVLWYHHRRVLGLIAIFSLGMLVWVQFGSMSFRHYVSYHKEPRYLTIVSAPVAVVGGAFLYDVWGRLSRHGRAIGGLFLLVVGIHAARLMHSEHLVYRDGREAIPSLVSWLKSEPTLRLWLRGSLQQELDLMFKYAFASPVHGHAGKIGYGALQDRSFAEMAQQGEYLLVSDAELKEGSWVLPSGWAIAPIMVSLPRGWRIYIKL